MSVCRCDFRGYFGSLKDAVLLLCKSIRISRRSITSSGVLILRLCLWKSRTQWGDWSKYEVYAPPLIVEVLSPSDRNFEGTNTPEKISRQRVAALSNGTREFWVVDADQRTVVVTTSEGVKLYRSGDPIPVSLTSGQSVSADAIFAKS
jgi:Uma2 family endonuclease